MLFNKYLDNTYVKSKKKNAITLKYNKNFKSMQLTASGSNSLAEKIINIAQEKDIKISRNSNFVEKVLELEDKVGLDSEASSLMIDTLCFLYQLEEELN